MSQFDSADSAIITISPPTPESMTLAPSSSSPSPPSSCVPIIAPSLRSKVRRVLPDDFKIPEPDAMNDPFTILFDHTFAEITPIVSTRPLPTNDAAVIELLEFELHYGVKCSSCVQAKIRCTRGELGRACYSCVGRGCSDCSFTHLTTLLKSLSFQRDQYLQGECFSLMRAMADDGHDSKWFDLRYETAKRLFYEAAQGALDRFEINRSSASLGFNSFVALAESVHDAAVLARLWASLKECKINPGVLGMIKARVDVLDEGIL
ncbi:hypothetical protein R3P38DRAFT_3296652 [Favolaschia claudopus]|uniref:Uncharacterized protein n=1 Tax=Favolaschia claudopus TaxID=2862362 RepID=A0AAV9Z8Z6_9AGAR